MVKREIGASELRRIADRVAMSSKVGRAVTAGVYAHNCIKDFAQVTNRIFLDGWKNVQLDPFQRQGEIVDGRLGREAGAQQGN